MTGAMKNIRDSHRRCGASCFQCCKSRRVVHDVIGQQNFFASTSLEIPRRGVIEPAENRDSGEEKNIRAVPEAMLRDGRARQESAGRGVFKRLRTAGARKQQETADHPQASQHASILWRAYNQGDEENVAMAAETDCVGSRTGHWRAVTKADRVFFISSTCL